MTRDQLILRLQRVLCEPDDLLRRALAGFILELDRELLREGLCYVDHATGAIDHMNAHIRTEKC